MENTKTKQKIINLSKFMSVIFKIVNICCVIGIIGISIGIVSLLIVDYTSITETIKQYFEGVVEIQEIDDLNNKQVLVNLIAALLSTIGGLVITKYLYKFFKGIVNAETPFNDNSVVCLNKVAIFTIVNAIAIPVIMWIICGIMNVFDLGVTYKAEGFNLYVSLIIFAIAYIFKYGVELQKENDQTL